MIDVSDDTHTSCLCPLKDKTVRFWDTRVNESLNTVLPLTYYDSMGSPVTSVCVDPTGKLMVSGHEDSSCILYDVRKNRQVQCFQPHTSDIRWVNTIYYVVICIAS